MGRGPANLHQGEGQILGWGSPANWGRQGQACPCPVHLLKRCVWVVYRLWADSRVRANEESPGSRERAPQNVRWDWLAPTGLRAEERPCLHHPGLSPHSPWDLSHACRANPQAPWHGEGVAGGHQSPYDPRPAGQASNSSPAPPASIREPGMALVLHPHILILCFQPLGLWIETPTGPGHSAVSAPTSSKQWNRTLRHMLALSGP